MLKFLERHFFLAVLVLFTIVYAYIDTGLRYNFTILSVFLSIGLLSLVGLFLINDQRGVSLNKTFCLYFYFFFSLAPIIQFKNNTVFFVEKNISDVLYLKSGLILLMILISYLVIYFLVFSLLSKKTTSSIPILKQSNVNTSRLYILSVLAILFYIYLIKFNWDLLIFRPFVFRLKFNTNLGLLGYAILLVVQLIPFCCFMYYKMHNTKNNNHVFLLLLMTLIVCFPTALSRGVLATIYIAVILQFFSFLHQKNNYTKMYFLGVLVAFPLFNNFRHFYERQFNFNYELFNTAHFDSFQNFSFLLDEKIVTNGRQLLGSIFFFVPESIWTNKPWGTGTLLAERLDYSFTNVAMSFFGEGYANFGYLGVAFFLVIIVFFNVFLDFLFANNKMHSWVKIIYYIFLGFEFYLLRGDLFSSIKILVSFGLALFLVILILYPIKKRSYLI